MTNQPRPRGNLIDQVAALEQNVEKLSKICKEHKLMIDELARLIGVDVKVDGTHELCKENEND